MSRSGPAPACEPARTAVIVVDFQNDYCSPRGAFGAAGTDLSMMPPAIERAVRVIDAARRTGALVIWLQQTVLPGGLSLPPSALRARNKYLAAERCVDGSFGHAIVEPLEPRPGEPVIKKLRSSGFVGTMLDLVLDSNGIETCVFMGVGTEGCVEATARSAAAHGYGPVILEDCVASTRMDLHACAVKTLGAQYPVIRSADVLEAWDAAPFTDRVRPGAARRQHASIGEILHPAHTALLVVEEPSRTDAGSGGAAPAAPARRCGDLVRAAQQADVPVVRLTTGQAAQAARHTGATDLVLDNPCLDGFVETPLRLFLREHGIHTVVLCGGYAERAVESTARSAHHLNFYVVCAADALAARDPALLEPALAIIRHRYDAVPADRIIAAWAGTRPAGARRADQSSGTAGRSP